MSLSQQESESIAAICLLAALADGTTSDVERTRLERVFALSGDSNHAEIYRRVVMGATSVDVEASRLSSDEARRTALDMAIGVCDADDATNDAERAFVRRLGAALRIDSSTVEEALRRADELRADLANDPVAFKAAGGPPPQFATASATAAAATSGALDAELDAMVLNYAKLTAAIELLPQSLATVAIIPLQVRMVYRIGARFGYQLSAAHAREFLGVVGLGMSSQILEGYARKLFGSLTRGVLGGMAGALAGYATGPAVTFAATYALGHVAKQYYAGGRTLSAIDLRAVYERAMDQGRKVYERHAGDVQRASTGLDVRNVMQLVNGDARA
ncbi:MAG: TerB family tellurite resistance protein [Phycisphaerales bacterium]